MRLLGGRASGRSGRPTDVACCFEAGRDGFWLQRLLTAHGVSTYVLEASSILVNRRGRHVKTDRIDAEAMVRVLAAWLNGDRLADSCGKPVAFALKSCNVADISMAIPLVAAVAAPRRLLADKAYDAESLRRWLKERRVKAVIPSTAALATPYPLDHRAYRRRNVIERLFCWLKNWRCPRDTLRQTGATTLLRSHSPPPPPPSANGANESSP